MSESLKAKIARRPLLAGALAALGIAAASGAAYETRWFGARYPASAYDDLLEKLPDRKNAIVLGRAVLAGTDSFDAEKTAATLREKIGDASLADAITHDIERNNLSEVRGWVLPVTLAELCALAAKAG